MESHFLADEKATRQFGADLAARLGAGDVVFLFGELGAGKTTLVRGLVYALGFAGEVRSPTYNLVQIYETEPPVVHADLYRVASAEGLGLEDFALTHLLLIEWPDRAFGLFPPEEGWRVELTFSGSGRRVEVSEPGPMLS
jgi:tRNA threonylcarbamoyladenosine biosynthesis protein TsaE